VAALNTGDWGGKTRVVRVNDWTTHWTYRDVVTVVEGAGQNLDCVMLPKVADAGQVTALDLLLTQIEKAMGFEVGREVPMLLIGEGTAEIQKMIVGRRLLEEYRTDS
jgi:citrate lyase subunit beta/citryl-CoA lyase